MNVDEISKVMQIYMLQSIYAGNNGTSNTSMMFELILQNMLKSMDSQDVKESYTKIESNSLAKDDNSINNKDTLSFKNMPNNIMDAIKQVSKRYGVEEELIKAVVKQESSFNSKAVSHAGAQGLMQLMPKTAQSLGVNNPFDVLDNLDGGTRYLKGLLDSFNGNKELALAAYNGGIGRMNKLGVDTIEEISRMPKETRNYVNKVVKNYENYKKI